MHTRPALTRCHLGLVGHDAHGSAVHASEADDDVSSVGRHDLEEVTLVHRLTKQQTTRTCARF